MRWRERRGCGDASTYHLPAAVSRVGVPAVMSPPRHGRCVTRRRLGVQGAEERSLEAMMAAGLSCSDEETESSLSEAE